MIDETGKTYGKLFVLGSVYDPNGKSHHKTKWECRCECGRITRVQGSRLRGTGNRVATISCVDCRNRRMGEFFKSQTDPETPFRCGFYHYKKRAEYDGLAFELDFDTFKQMILSPCHYCGIAPMTRAHDKVHTYQANGIDRVDSRQGYTRDNIVPCCEPCNYAKSDYSKEEFLAWVQRAYKHNFGGVDGIQTDINRSDKSTLGGG